MDFVYDTETWKTFFEDNWLILALALVALLVIIGIVRTVVKWALVAIIVIGVIAYSGYSLEDVKSLGGKVADSVKQEAITAMAGEASEATYTKNNDGSFTVKTDNLELTGKANADEVEVKFRGTKIGSWKIDDTIRTLIDTAKSNS
ncbi:hypothetical protein DFQ01_102390 [Paenibacillus cellulosilyticus]|uniref:Uncharacterized protein n=1 Tax=Paenibacillus cellulosilyticus TaxID=375489 RepID=A0A2V2YZ05_9BACL|nr:hypothetical protein [Paenibacillus cellulosilyticus]PWW07493.1 hypothetical protein DFQ01_102390 [Paenibacillus cellulosilyticus]QKS44353.1 hypothetical protein HUB94_07945 [Paenibacillus cellulosilyticus]